MLQRNKLYYFTDDGAKRAKGLFYLRTEYKSCEQIDNERYIFKIFDQDNSNVKPIYLRADTINDMCEWVSVIRKALGVCMFVFLIIERCVCGFYFKLY